MPIKDYSTDPDLNVSISGINIAEGCPPSGINNAIRQLMADVKVESEAVSEAVSETSSALEAFADQQAAKDEEQDTAISNAQQTADAALPKAGGTMTGSLNVKDNSFDVTVTPETNSYSKLVSVIDKNNKNVVALQGVKETTGDNVAQLVMSDVSGNNIYPMIIRVTTEGVKIVDTNGGQLKAVGGTMAGPIISSASGNGAIRANSNSSQIRICGGSNSWTYGGIGIWYGIQNENYPGGWAHVAMNPDGQGGNVALRGYYDSATSKFRLTWNNGAVHSLVAEKKGSDSWYRKYSDGWIEQGGTVTSTSDVGGAGITFPTPFATSNYIFMANTTDNGAWMARAMYTWRNKTNTGITLVMHIYGNDSGRFRGYMWYACGY